LAHVEQCERETSRTSNGSERFQDIAMPRLYKFFS
jgi:hypothetical protein